MFVDVAGERCARKWWELRGNEQRFGACEKFSLPFSHSYCCPFACDGRESFMKILVTGMGNLEV